MFNIHDYLVYDTESPSGIRWLRHWNPAMNTRSSGKPFGAIQKNGYFMGSFNNRRWYAHRLVWLLHYGSVPAQLDHIDGDKTNNRIENLRPVTNQENSQNRRDCVGASWQQVTQCWQVGIQHAGRKIYVGRYSCLLDARAAYIRMKRHLHTHNPFEVNRETKQINAPIRGNLGCLSGGGDVTRSFDPYAACGSDVQQSVQVGRDDYQ